jgi:hypothetical protein
MRPGPVVIVEVLAKDMDQVALAQDDQPVQTLSSQGAQYPLAGGIGAGSVERGSAILMPAAEKTASKSDLYFESRSRISTVIGIFSSSTPRPRCAPVAPPGLNRDLRWRCRR